MRNNGLNAHHAMKGDLTVGPVPALLVRMTVPMIWGLFALISLQLADMYFISRIGTEPLIAIGFTFPVTMIILSLSVAMGIATSSLVSRRIGEGDRDGARRMATHAVIIAAIAGLLITAVGIPSMDLLFRSMGADGAVLAGIKDFMTVCYAGSVFMTVLMVGNAALRATGDTTSPALILVGCAVINVILDPILIFGFAGLPPLGLQGAAIANLISTALAAMAGLYVLTMRRGLVVREHCNFKAFGESLAKFLVIALPVGIANIMQPAVSTALTGMMARFGHEGVAAYGIAARIEAFAFIIIMALATGMGPIIGQNWGAGKPERVRETLKAAFTFVIAWSLLISLFLILFGQYIAQRFTSEPDVIRTAMMYFWVVSSTYAFGNLVNGWASAFNAMGMPEKSFAMILARLLLVTLPLAAIGAHFYGTFGIFAGVAAANIICGISTHVICWRIMRRQEQNLAQAAI
jgi:putative MATE family efflux protein